MTLLAEQDPIEKAIEEQEKTKSPSATESAPASASVPVVNRPETAWERGLRQAKEMKRLSQQRKETDIEYEEKRTTMSLTQAELDRENDYYMRPASPIRDNDDDFFDHDDMAEEVPRLRRVAPPPPPEFQSRPSRRYPSPPPPGRRNYRSPSPPSRIRRVAPPRSPEIGGPRHRRGDEWADPWMRNNEGRRSSRKRSYSSGSSRSSSKSSSSRSRSPSVKRSRRRRTSSASSKSSRSRSRSSTPEGIPRRGNPDRRSESPTTMQSRNTAPLQKRLMNLASSSTGIIRNIKKEPEDKASSRRRRAGRSASSASSRSSSSSRSRSRSPHSPSRRNKKPAVLTEEPIEKPQQDPADEVKESSTIPEPKTQIRMTLKTSNAVTKPMMGKNVLENLGTNETSSASEILENAKAKREENKLKKAHEIKKEKKDKKEKKSAADRREELLKQLKAVENAIAKKRTKINQESGK